MKYFIGALMIAVGVVLVIKTEWFVRNFGHSAWAESKFGSSGGTRVMYKGIGIIFIFFGFLLVTNMMTGFLNATVIKLFVK